MIHFWDSDVWSWVLLFAVLTGALLVGNTLRRKISFLRNSLIPTSVLGGLILMIISMVYSAVTDGDNIFNTEFFGGKGGQALDVITYHALALGFIATSFKPRSEGFSK